MPGTRQAAYGTKPGVAVMHDGIWGRQPVHECYFGNSIEASVTIRLTTPGEPGQG